MRVRDILYSKGEETMTIEPSALVEQLACRLGVDKVGAMLVLSPAGALQGVVTERHIVRAILDYGPRALAMTVAEIMDRAPITCAPEDSIAYVARLMTQRRVRHVPVMSHGSVKGVVSIGDVVKHRLEELELETGVLRDRATLRGLADDTMMESPLYR